MFKVNSFFNIIDVIAEPCLAWYRWQTLLTITKRVDKKKAPTCWMNSTSSNNIINCQDSEISWWYAHLEKMWIANIFSIVSVKLLTNNDWKFFFTLFVSDTDWKKKVFWKSYSWKKYMLPKKKAYHLIFRGGVFYKKLFLRKIKGISSVYPPPKKKKLLR